MSVKITPASVSVTPGLEYTWVCKECGTSTQWSMFDCQNSGTPTCDDCGNDMTLPENQEIIVAPSRKQYVRLLAEAHAAMSPNAIEDMAESLNIPVDRLLYIFEKNERDWEIIKANIDSSGPSKYRRVVVQVEVLVRDEYLNPSDLENLSFLANEVVFGDSSGSCEVVSVENVDPFNMAQLLLAQGSDPEYFELNPDGSSLEEEGE